MKYGLLGAGRENLTLDHSSQPSPEIPFSNKDANESGSQSMQNVKVKGPAINRAGPSIY